MVDDGVKNNIGEAIKAFEKGNLSENALKLFQTLGYNTDRQSPLSKPVFAEFRDDCITPEKSFNESKALCSEWEYVDLLFQLSKEEVLKQTSLFDTKQVDNTIIETYLFFAIELSREHYTRTALSNITREVNKLFPMPVMILFKYGNTLTLSVIYRRLHKRDDSKDVLEKVTQIKDINIENYNRAHIEILFDLSFDELKRKYNFTNFVELHNAWQKTLDIKELNKQFYQKLFNWYLWTLKETRFPQIRPDSDKIENKIHQSESLIRLLTRLLFVWFMKEKGLINPDLFNENILKSILKNFKGSKGVETIYYKAILQNLFFATLNKPIDQRKVIDKGFNPREYGDPLVYRFDELFVEPENVLEYFDNIPFLNGGLFECLDQKKDKDNPVEIRLDGFSVKKSKQVILPDKYFFGEYKNIDLSDDYDDKKKTNLTVYGIIDILSHYKFTVEENTPIEEEIALDPELLGKVFENLLASYNPETQTTARKQTGSFYTPREIVNYMVDESLIAYLKNSIDDEDNLRELFSYNDKVEANPFNASETKILVSAIDNCKILDPACGSGAFPMGVLQKLTHILHKLDPENNIWFDMVIGNLPAYMQKEARKRLKKENWNYVRKLGVVQQCIYGVDIQPIATQIAKLRFFISLLVDQTEKPGEPNRGLEPLPNLDFKIVTANTLISAPENEAIEAYAKDSLQNFEKLTNEYFSSVADEKIRISEEIKKCTQKIVDANQKVINQWIGKIRRESNSATSAKKKKMEKQMEQFQQDLDRWNTFTNIYKHESVAFFETKYFFPQVKDGFDVVIGNPPYVDSETMIKENPKYRELLKDIYECAVGNWDLFVVFVEKALNLSVKNGCLSFIVSNKLISAKYTYTLREFLNNKTIIELIDYSYVDVFKEVDVYPIVLIAKNERNSTSIIKTKVMSDLLEVRTINYIEPKLFYKDIFWDKYFFNKDILNLIIKLTNNDKLSKYFPKIIGSATVSEAYQIKTIIQELSSQNNFFKFINTGTIDSYVSLWSLKTTQYIKDSYNLPIITFDDLKTISEARYYQSKSSKIIIAGMALRIEAFYDHGEYCAGKSTSIILGEEKELKTLTGILNSNTVTFWFSKYFNSLSMSGGYFNIGNNELGLIPIPKKIQLPINAISRTVDYISFLKINLNAKNSFFEKLTNAMVYELYFPEEIKEAGCEVLKYLNNFPELKEEWDDNKKLEVIEQVHKELSEPNHPVSVAMFKMDTVEEIRIIEGKQ